MSGNKESNNTSNKLNYHKRFSDSFPTNESSNVPSEEQNTTNKTTKRQQYFEQNINLNERTYYAQIYQYIPQIAIEKNALSNNNGNQNVPLNNNGYVMALPANTTTRIDPSLLNYGTMQVAANHVQPYTPPLPTGNNPVSNNQTLYWNGEVVQTQMVRPLPSYYKTIPSGTTTLEYENLAQRTNHGNRATNSSLVTDPTLRNKVQPNKGKKKRCRKPKSDYVMQCSNCGVRKTPAWRRDEHGIALLCNACGLYLKNKGVHRPTVIAPNGTTCLERSECRNCGSTRELEGQKLCNKCDLFLKQHGYAQPSRRSRKSSSYTY